MSPDDVVLARLMRRLLTPTSMPDGGLVFMSLHSDSMVIEGELTLDPDEHAVIERLDEGGTG